MSELPVGDNQAALTFLQWLRPAGPWSLTAIHPDRKGIETRTFGPDTEAALNGFLTAHNGQRNIYFMVNPALHALDKKAMKEDVASMDWLHVDCDPPKGADFDSSRAGILQRLRAFSPAPSVIIDSGGGYQGFWRLDAPVWAGGNLSRVEELEAYNQQLETVLQGDHCFNLDRIMRLPGTVNLPDEKKRAAGRQPRLATVVGELTGLVYSLDKFTAAPRVQTSSSRNASPVAVHIDGNLPSILVDDLPASVNQRTKMLICQGTDPDEPTKYKSGSEVMWAVACQMVRAGCDDNTIAAILLDADYPVSAHVFRQKRPVEYVARQLQRAREFAEDPWLKELNEKHAVILDMGGKCRVISEVLDHSLKPPRPRITKQSFEDFRNRYMNKKVEVGKDKEGNPIVKPVGGWWLAHERRRQYETIVFSPEIEVPGSYNLWQGFACEALPGDGHQAYLTHLKNNVCSGNEEQYQYLVNWMARGVQHPGSQGEVAVVLRGGRGAGKGTVATVYGSLWGRHFLHISSAKHMVGNFNAHLRDCVFLFADEAFFAGDKQHESSLKTLVTEDTNMIEPKGVDAELAPNYVHLMMSSNQDWVVPAGPDERRYLVLDVGEEHKQDLAYFRAIKDQMANGGKENLLHFLMTLDISNFEVRQVPQTRALQAQKTYSMSLEEGWWLERLTDGRTVGTKPGWLDTLPKGVLYSDYLRFAESQRVNRRMTPTALGMFLKKVLPGAYPIGVQRTADCEKIDGQGLTYTVRERQYFYDMPRLQESREHWCALFGQTAWPAESAEDEPGVQPELADAPY